VLAILVVLDVAVLTTVLGTADTALVEAIELLELEGTLVVTGVVML
jgi:hypothetical protein